MGLLRWAEARFKYRHVFLLVNVAASALEATRVNRTVQDGALATTEHLRMQITLGVSTLEAWIFRHHVERMFWATELLLTTCFQR